MNTPIRHHFIPQLILRNFVDEDGYLYCYSRQGGRIFKSAPGNVFFEKHLYAQYDEQGRENASVETEISESIDGPVAPVLNKIVKSARNGTLPGLTESEKKTWDEFFCCQLRRVPAARQSLLDSEIVSEVLNEFERGIRPLSIAEREEYNDPEMRKELTHNAWTRIIAEGEGELMDVIQNKGLAIGVIEGSRKSFIIGDNPTIRIAPHGHTHLRDPKVELLFPIAHDIIVTPGYRAGSEGLTSLADSVWIRKVNEFIFRRSQVIAGRSRKLVASLSRVWAK